MMAENSASSSSYDVRMSALMSESRDRISRHTSIPEPSGRRPSRIATSGRTAGIRRMASAASPDSPTTTMSPALSSRSLMPRRTISWSSSRYTRIGSTVSVESSGMHRNLRAGHHGGRWSSAPRVGTLVPASRPRGRGTLMAAPRRGERGTGDGWHASDDQRSRRSHRRRHGSSSPLGRPGGRRVLPVHGRRAPGSRGGRRRGLPPLRRRRTVRLRPRRLAGGLHGLTRPCSGCS